MATLPQVFNAHQVEPAGIPSPMLPVSDSSGHPVIITASEFKATKGNSNNGYLELTLMICDGQHKGETGSYRLNLFHENPQTVDIASRQLSAICHVTNQMMISDSQQLHNIPFRVIVGMQKKQKPEDPDYTEVKGVLDINGDKPGKGNRTTMPAQSPAQSPAPWPNPAQPAQSSFPIQQTPSESTAVRPPWAK